MFLGLRTVIYPTVDFAAATAWYTQAIGQAPYFNEPFYVGFNIGGFELGLVPDGWRVETIDDFRRFVDEVGVPILVRRHDTGLDDQRHQPELQRVSGDGQPATGAGESAAGFPAIAGAASVQLPGSGERQRFLRGYELQCAHCRLVRSEHAHAVRHDVVGRYTE